MEEHGRERIRANLHQLVTYTICDAELLTFCHQKGVLGVNDIDEIATLRKHTDKANKFYQIIQTRTNSYPILLAALRKTDQAGVAEILETGVVPPTLEKSTRVRQILYDDERDIARIRLLLLEFNAAPCAPPDPIFDVSPPVPLFTGRRMELDELHQKVQRSLEGGNGQPVVISQLTTISGLGGIGKTQLSKQYVKEFRQHFDDNCLWLNAETEGSLGESFRTLAKDRLNISTEDANGAEKKMQTIVGDVYRFFQDRKGLFVFDNAERAPWLKQFLPMTSAPAGPGQYRPCILITSRTREWEKGVEVIDLNELELGDAVAMVKKGLGLEGDASQDGDITLLVKRLQCFPLAMQQAISYIEDQQVVTDYSVLTYLEDFKRQQEELLSFDEMNNEIRNDYKKTTLTTWKMTVEKIAQDVKFGKVALHILYAMAYLSPENMERKMFLGLPDTIPNEKALVGGVRLLLRYSMARGDDKQRLLSIHRLVQEVTRMELVSKDREVSTLANVLTMLGGNELNIDVLPRNVDHRVTVWRHTWVYTELIERFYAMSAITIGMLSRLGRSSEAISFGNETLGKLSIALHENHEAILLAKHSMAHAMSHQADTLKKGEHLQVMRDVLDRYENIYGEGDSRILVFKHSMGLMLNRAFLFEEAFPHLQSAYEKWNVEMMSSRPGIFTRSFCENLIGLGRADEALKILITEYPKIKSTEDGTSIISTRTVMGECLNELGNFDEALKILTEDFPDMANLSIFERTRMIYLLVLLGKVLRNKGNFESATGVHNQACDLALDSYGPRDGIIIPYKERAISWSRMGKHEAAIKVFEFLVKEMSGTDDFPTVIQMKIHLADALTQRGGGNDLDRASKILLEQRAKLVEKGWEELAVFKNDFGKEIKRIQDDISVRAHNMINPVA